MHDCVFILPFLGVCAHVLLLLKKIVAIDKTKVEKASTTITFTIKKNLQ